MKLLKKGSRGGEIKTLQTALRIMADGIFGKLTLEAVRDFQKERGLAVDGIVGPDTWAEIGKIDTGTFPNRGSRKINELIIHCSDTREGKDYSVDQIRQWHLQRGFNDIGYHYVIYRDGTVANGRDVNISGAHCLNHNLHSIGICYVGGRKADGKTFADTRTREQRQALDDLIHKLRAMYPEATVHGHNEFANKACPCFDVRKEFK